MPIPRKQPGPEMLFTGTLVLLLLIAYVSDQWIFHHFTFPGVYDRGWGRMLRLAGYFPRWGVVALALVPHDWLARTLATLRHASGRCLLKFGSAALGRIAEQAP